MFALGHTLRRGLMTSARLGGEVEYGSATAGGRGGGYKFWRNLSLFVGIPACALCTLSCYLEHVNGGHSREPFVNYEHLRMRTKKFPWGDGNHSFFHHPQQNALPEGYEVEEEPHH